LTLTDNINNNKATTKKQKKQKKQKKTKNNNNTRGCSYRVTLAAHTEPTNRHRSYRVTPAAHTEPTHIVTDHTESHWLLIQSQQIGESRTATNATANSTAVAQTCLGSGFQNHSEPLKLFAATLFSFHLQIPLPVHFGL
jgi:hypothetical protein